MKLEKLLSPFGWWVVGVFCVGAAPVLLHLAMQRDQELAWLGFLASIALSWLAFSEAFRNYADWKNSPEERARDRRLYHLQSVQDIVTALERDDERGTGARGMFYHYEEAVEHLMRFAIKEEEKRSGESINLVMYPVIGMIVRLHLARLLDEAELREGTDLGRLRCAVLWEVARAKETGITSDGRAPDVARWLEERYPSRRKGE